MSGREYKTVALPQLHRVRRRIGRSHAETVAALVTKVINEWASRGWRYVGADSFHTKERRGLLGARYEADLTLLVFEREATGAAMPDEPEMEMDDEPRRGGLRWGLGRRGPSPAPPARHEPPRNEPPRHEPARPERPAQRAERPVERPMERPAERPRRPAEPVEPAARRASPPVRPFRRTREATEPDFDEFSGPTGRDPEPRESVARPRPRGAAGSGDGPGRGMSEHPVRGRRTRD